MVATKGLRVICWPFGGWQVRPRRQGAQAVASRDVTGLTAAHALIQVDAFWIVVALDTCANFGSGVVTDILFGRRRATEVTGCAADEFASTIAAVPPMAEPQVSLNECPRASWRHRRFAVALCAVAHLRCARRGGLWRVAPGAGCVSRPLHLICTQTAGAKEVTIHAAEVKAQLLLHGVSV